MNKGEKPQGKSAAMRIIAMVVAFCVPLSLALVLHGTLFGNAPGHNPADAATADALAVQG